MKITDKSELLESQFEHLLRLWEKGADIDQLLASLVQLVELSPISYAAACSSGTNLHRSTCHHTCIPKSVEEIWYPPSDCVTELGRANRVGQSIFYCSSDPSGAVAELRPTPDQIIVLSDWITTDRMRLHKLGYSADVFSQSGCRRQHPIHDRKFYENRLSNTGKKIWNFIASTFVSPSKDRYPLTAAISDLYMKSDQINGICYPSISQFANVDNIALKPEFVQTSLRLKSARLFRLVEIHEDASLVGDILCELQHVTPSGELEWNCEGQKTPIPPGQGYELEAGMKRRLLGDGFIECEGKRYEVKSGYSIENTESGSVVKNLRGDQVMSAPSMHPALS